MRSSSLLLLVGVVLVGAACAEPFSPDDPCDANLCTDAPPLKDVVDDDIAVDISDGTDAPKNTDVAHEVGGDMGLDARVDSALDAATDASRDATNELMVDVVDATTDASRDATNESAVDVVDATTDMSRDATSEPAVDVVDATTDTSRDATNESAVDVFDATTDRNVVDALDAGPDVADVRTDVTTAVDVAPTGGCVSGAVGTYVARFRWVGSGSRSRATVSYETNTLPDTSRWRVTANSRSIGYTPVFDDIFLGVGGLDLSGTGFIDVELSTAGLASISNVTIAVFGRSFNTTASGSYAWRTFTGMGAAPSGLVFNSAPYQWYRANATGQFVPGDGSVLLRITPGPPSGSLIVNRIEICFDAR
jgi:hypothetical protein